MTRIHRRFLIYILLGTAFGVLDWFYLNALAHFSWGSLGNSLLVVPIILLLNYGIWLVPVIPIGIYEIQQKTSITFSMLACIIPWVCAMIGYYGYYAILFIQGKLPMLDHVRLLGIHDIAFWQENWGLFQRLIINQFIEWTLIATACGAILGALLFRIVHRNKG